MLGELKPPEIEEVIQHQVVGRIGCHADGVTYVVPVSYAYDGEYVYVHSYQGLKVDLMRKNRQVCFQVDAMHDLGNWKSVVAWGEYEELSDEGSRDKAFNKLMERNLPTISSEMTHLSPLWPFPATDVNSVEGIFFRIKLTRKTGRFENIVPASIFAT